MSLRTDGNSLPLLCFEWKPHYTRDPLFRDDFDDAAIGADWTVENTDANRTITEAGDVVTIAITSGTDGQWAWANINAPRMILDLDNYPERPLEIVARVNSFTVNDKVFTGLFIARDINGTGCPTPANAIFWGRYRDDTRGNGIAVTNNCWGIDAFGYLPAHRIMPMWFRIYIDTFEVLTFWYSTDGENWTQADYAGTPYSLAGYIQSGIKIGIMACNNLTALPPWFNAISAPFEFFQIDGFSEEDEVEECVAPIDVRAPSVFYHGRIKRMSALKRAIDDKTGLFQIADMNVTLSNADKRYSKLLVTHQLKNREATLYHAWSEEPEASKSHVITMIVDDYSLEGTEFHIKLKDITQKYFAKKVPENICTSDEFPDIHPDHAGRCMPEILGNATLPATYEHPGAVEAVYVDTTGPPYRCLASAGFVTIPANNVWIDDVQKTQGVHYTVVQAGGRTYIHFVAGQDPGDGTVAFNAHGYSIAAWDSPNGYIQNLAYIIEYYLQYIMGIPISLLDAASFDTLATHYADRGVEEDCYLVIQDRQDAMEILRQLLFTGGAKGFMAMDGKFTVERKTLANWQIASTEQHLIEQIDLLAPPKRLWNLPSAINTIKAQFGYIPWQRMFMSAMEEYRENFYDTPMEDDIEIPEGILPI